MSKLRDLVRQHKASIQSLSAVYSGHASGIWQCNAKLIASTGYTVCHNDDPEAGMIEALERAVQTLAVCGGVSGLKTQERKKPKPPVFDDDDLLGGNEEAEADFDDAMLGMDHDEEDLLG